MEILRKKTSRRTHARHPRFLKRIACGRFRDVLVGPASPGCSTHRFVFCTFARGDRVASRRTHTNDLDDEGATKSEQWSGTISREDAHTFARSCGGARAGSGCIDLWDGPAHLRLGPVVRGSHQAAGHTGARVLWSGGARGQGSRGSEGRRLRERRDARELRALPSVPARRSAHLSKGPCARHRPGRCIRRVRARPSVERLETRSRGSRALWRDPRSPGVRSD
jgi:hypothetical protein